MVDLKLDIELQQTNQKYPFFQIKGKNISPVTKVFMNKWSFLSDPIMASEAPDVGSTFGRQYPDFGSLVIINGKTQLSEYRKTVSSKIWTKFSGVLLSSM